MLFVVLLLTFLPIAAVSSASAADATGCSGTAQSYSDEGGLLDSMAAPGIGGTKADPFDIFSDGGVRYTGRTDAVMRNGTWKVEVGGAIGVLAFLAETISQKDLLSGRINDIGDNTRTGEFAAKKYAGNLTGLQVVTVRLRGADGAACDATVWIRMHGAFLESILAVGGVIAIVIAFILFIFGVPTWAIDNLLFEQLESRLSPSVPDDKE
jgi:hypothetical protein